MDHIRAASFKNVIVIAFLHDISRVEEIDMAVRRQSTA